MMDGWINVLYWSKIWKLYCCSTKNKIHKNKLYSCFKNVQINVQQTTKADVQKTVGMCRDQLYPGTVGWCYHSYCQSWILGAKQGGTGDHFYSLWWDLAGNQTHNCSPNMLHTKFIAETLSTEQLRFHGNEACTACHHSWLESLGEGAGRWRTLQSKM